MVGECQPCIENENSRISFSYFHRYVTPLTLTLPLHNQLCVFEHTKRVPLEEWFWVLLAGTPSTTKTTERRAPTIYGMQIINHPSRFPQPFWTPLPWLLLLWIPLLVRPLPLPPPPPPPPLPPPRSIPPPYPQNIRFNRSMYPPMLI